MTKCNTWHVGASTLTKTFQVNFVTPSFSYTILSTDDICCQSKNWANAFMQSDINDRTGSEILTKFNS